MPTIDFFRTQNDVVLTGTFQKFQPDPVLMATSWRIVNDEASGGASIEYSFDGTNIHGEIRAGEDLTDDHRQRQEIFLRAAGGAAYRLWAWRANQRTAI